MTPPQPPTASTVQDVYVLPGEVRVSNEPTRFLTILGSCVAICIYDDVHGVGGINHFLLPGQPQPGDREPLRWSVTSTTALVERMRDVGAMPSCMKAKLFGGASIGGRPAMESMRIGDRNAESARQELFRLRIPVEIEDTGGPSGRKIIFESRTGLVWVKKLHHPH